MHATSVRQTRKQNPLMTDGDRTKCGVTERATDPEEYEKKVIVASSPQFFCRTVLGRNYGSHLEHGSNHFLRCDNGQKTTDAMGKWSTIQSCHPCGPN